MASSNTAERLVRAANFFALRAFWKSPKQATEVWDFLGERLDVSKPLDRDVLPLVGRFDIDESALRAAVEMARRSLDALEPDDRILEWRQPGYPRLLNVLADAPRFLFVRTNDFSILDMPAIAVVGTRHPSDEGRGRARKLAYLLAKRDIAVASGLALGIDTAAHQGALDFDGKTLGVIGTPLTVSYPKENTDLQRIVGRVGALVSQFHPGAATTRLSFPLRNATMSGLSLGTVIIEAGETSGALIQAQHCLAQRRKLFIPRSAVENSALNWPKKYLARGAIEFSTIDDLIGALEREHLLPAQMHGPGAPVEVFAARAAGG